MSGKVKFTEGTIIKELKKLEKMEIIVGFAGEKAKKKVEGAEYTIGEYANVLDKGTENGSTPARPFFREALIFPEAKKQLKEYMSKHISLVCKGSLNAEQFCQKIGQYGVGRIKEKIKTGHFVPLKAATLKRKNKGTILIEKGNLIGAAEFEVNKK